MTNPTGKIAQVAVNTATNHAGHAVGHAGHAVGAAVGTGLMTMISSGLTALVSYTVAKYKLHRKEVRLRNINIQAKKLVAWKVAQAHRLERMRLAPGLQKAIQENGGILGLDNGDRANGYVYPICLDIRNDFVNKAIDGWFSAQSGVVVDLYKYVMDGIIDYLISKNALNYDGDTNRYTLKEGQMDPGVAAMLVFGNELSMLIIHLAQVSNAVVISDADRHKQKEESTKLVNAIHLCIEDAFRPGPKNKPNEGGILRVHATGFGRITKGAARAVFGFENGREVALKQLLDSVRNAKLTDEPSIVERLATASLEDAWQKSDQARASELVRATYEACDVSVRASVSATQTVDSKGIGEGPATQLYREGIVHQKVTLHNVNKQVELTENYEMFSYWQQCLDKRNNQIIAMPVGQPDFMAVGDLNKEVKSITNRSAEYVAPDIATADMKKWLHITYLRTVAMQVADAYSQEVTHSGAKSPMAIYFLQLLKTGLEHIQELVSELSVSPLFRQMIRRSVYYYDTKHHGAVYTKSNTVKLGLSNERVAIREADISGYFDAPESKAPVQIGSQQDQENRIREKNLADLTEANGATLTTALRKEAGWHVYMYKKVNDLIAFSEIDSTIKSDRSKWDATDSRAKVWDLFASLAVDPVGADTQDKGLESFRRQMQGWSVKQAAWIEDQQSNDEQKAVVAIAQTHQKLTKTYQESIKSVNLKLTQYNSFLDALYDNSENEYEKISQDLVSLLEGHRYLQIQKLASGRVHICFSEGSCVNNYDYHLSLNVLPAVFSTVMNHIETNKNPKLLEKTVKVCEENIRKLSANEKLSKRQKNQLQGNENRLALAQWALQKISIKDIMQANKGDVIKQLSKLPVMTAKQLGIAEKEHAEINAASYAAKQEREARLNHQLDEKNTILKGIQKDNEKLAHAVEVHKETIAEVAKQVCVVSDDVSEIKNDSQSVVDKTTDLLNQYAKLCKGFVKQDEERKTLADKIFNHFDDVVLRWKTSVAQLKAKQASLPTLKEGASAEEKRAYKDNGLRLQGYSQATLEIYDTEIAQLTHALELFKGEHADLNDKSVALTEQLVELNKAKTDVENNLHALQTALNKLSGRVDSLEKRLDKVENKGGVSLEFSMDGFSKPVLRNAMGRSDTQRNEKATAVYEHLEEAQQALSNIRYLLKNGDVEINGTEIDKEEAFKVILKTAAIAHVHRSKGIATLDMTKSSRRVAAQMLAMTGNNALGKRTAFLVFLQNQVKKLEGHYAAKNGRPSTRRLNWFTGLSQTKLANSKKINNRILARILKECVKMQYRLTTGRKYNITWGGQNSFNWDQFADELYPQAVEESVHVATRSTSINIPTPTEDQVEKVETVCTTRAGHAKSSGHIVNDIAKQNTSVTGVHSAMHNSIGLTAHSEKSSSEEPGQVKDLAAQLAELKEQHARQIAAIEAKFEKRQINESNLNDSMH